VTKEEAKAAVEQAYARFVSAHPNARDHWEKHMAELEARLAARSLEREAGQVPWRKSEERPISDPAAGTGREHRS
jgi:hypothetical protein